METDRVLAFHHTRPSFEAHIVVIPKKHIPSLIEFDDQDKEILTELLGVVQEVARQVNATMELVVLKHTSVNTNHLNTYMCMFRLEKR